MKFQSFFENESTTESEQIRTTSIFEMLADTQTSNHKKPRFFNVDTASRLQLIII